MADYRQSEACPKFGTAQGGGASSGAGYGRNAPQGYPDSYTVFAPQAQPQNEGAPTRWTPYGTFVSHPYVGGHDGLGGKLMHVPQADFYNSEPNPWPASGVDDQPNNMYSIMRLEPTTSAHPGYSLPSVASPSMIFNAPPIFGLQTVPIPAMGL